MTKDQIEKLEAGAEIDLLVAREVMGCKDWDGISDYDAPDGMIYFAYEWYPSTRISIAWRVVEKLRKDGLRFTFKIRFGEGPQVAEFTKRLDEEFFKDFHAEAPTAPLAICRAALLATMEENK